MKKLRSLWRVVWPVFALVFVCEYLIYYIVLSQCHYPKLKTQSSSSPLNAMFLADTHLLGSRKGHWFDKLRREWQMHRAFQTANTIFAPELVVFLGDVFDEGKWCDQDEFDQYVQRFSDLFYVDRYRTEVKVVAGNHDIGFHYSVTPYLNDRFQEAFQIKPVERFSVKGIQFVAVNSMAMEGDKCFLCKEAEEEVQKVAKELLCIRDKEACEVDYDFGSGSGKPILLQHFPLFRHSDSECDEADQAPPDEKDNPFKEKWDCLSKESTSLLLSSLKPRLVLSGHTHHGCKVMHNGDVPEWSISSFSWRNRNNPTFILATFDEEDLALYKCFMPEEDTVINMYIWGGVLYIGYLIRLKFFTKRRW